MPIVREAGTHHKTEQVPVVREIDAYCKGSNVPTVRGSRYLL